MAFEVTDFVGKVDGKHIGEDVVAEKGDKLIIKRIERNRANGICETCKYEGRTYHCFAAKVNWSNRAKEEPRLAGRDEYWDKSEIVECNYFTSKFIRPEGDGEITKLKQEFFDLGYWVEASKTGDIESGTYYTYVIYKMDGYKRISGGAPYDLIKALKNEIKELKPKEVKFIESVNTDKVQLEVLECKCGFHLGIDSTFIDQVDDVRINCPSCGEEIDTSKIEELKGE